MILTTPILAHVNLPYRIVIIVSFVISMLVLDIGT